ncbi:MAG: hypothetical protein E7665_02815 [Ruminococcaceae bacterium]|nr:hypothetical protein [Oscillospiraceae bacterium]
MKDLKNKRISGYKERYCSALKRNVPILCCRENGCYSEVCEAECTEKKSCAFGNIEEVSSSFSHVSANPKESL